MVGEKLRRGFKTGLYATGKKIRNETMTKIHFDFFPKNIYNGPVILRETTGRKIWRGEDKALYL